jgi:hypothetical protein
VRVLVVAVAIVLAAAIGALIAIEVGHHVEAVTTTTTTRTPSLASAKARAQTAQTRATLKAGCFAGSELTQQIHEAAYVPQIPIGAGSAFQTVSALGDEGYPAAYAKVAADANDVASDFSLLQRLGQSDVVLADLTHLAHDCADLGVSTGAG